jgi:hypothetical protein
MKMIRHTSLGVATIFTFNVFTDGTTSSAKAETPAAIPPGKLPFSPSAQQRELKLLRNPLRFQTTSPGHSRIRRHLRRRPTPQLTKRALRFAGRPSLPEFYLCRVSFCLVTPQG